MGARAGDDFATMTPMLRGRDEAEIPHQHLADAEQRHRELLKFLPVAIVVFDGNGSVVLANDKASAMFRLPHDLLMKSSPDKWPLAIYDTQGVRAAPATCPHTHVLATGAAVRVLAQAMEGDISVGSVLGIGSRFTVHLRSSAPIAA